MIKNEDVRRSVEAYVDAVDHEFARGIAETLAYDDKYLSNGLGWRTAGSDAEHRAADYIVDMMREAGLSAVEKVAVTLDKWQFNGASLTVEGTDIDIMPASYATNGTDAKGLTAQIMDLGTGFAADYEGKDVRGKIVLVGVDQWNVAWINSYMQEAYIHGAAAIVSYSLESGYGALSDDMINMQDLCGRDLMPCVSISRNQYKKLSQAIKDGYDVAKLIVDNEMVPGGGTGYNVVGRIPGRSSEQQIIVSGHYDVYFNGFQDDCCAIGLVLAMAKALTGSGYEPEKDILFVAHCAEEWAATGTQFDWTRGAWEMINHARPEWAGKTVAMFNFELPALYDGAEKFTVQCDPELAAVTKKLIEESDLMPEIAGGVYPGGYDSTTVDNFCLEDGVSYRAAGVPHFINVPGFSESDDNWNRNRYHTSADDRETYNADVMTSNLNAFGAMLIYVDQTPALELDLTATCDDIDEALDDGEAAAAGADADGYRAASAAMRKTAGALKEKTAALNAAYAKARAGGAPKEELDAIRKEAEAFNARLLKAFKYIQDDFIGIVVTSTMIIKHVAYQDNIKTLCGVVDALRNGRITGDEKIPGALDLAWRINGDTQFEHYHFSPETCAMSQASLHEKTNPGRLFWGTGKGSVFADTSDATMSLLDKAAAAEAGGEVTFDEEISLYEKALADQRRLLRETMEKEAAAMKRFAGMFGEETKA